MTDPYIVFKINNKKYATDALKVVEIINYKPIDFFDKMPPDILGIISFREQVINILDIKKTLGVAGDKKYKKIIIININETLAGIPVDKVEDIINVEKTQITSTPYNNRDKFLKNLIKLDNTFLSIIDFEDTFPLDIFKKIPEEIIQKNPLAKTSEYNIQPLEKNDSFISFKLEKNVYCINFNYIKEFAEFSIKEITHIPHTPNYFKGIINLRGELINIFDIREFLNIECLELQDKVKTIIISAQDIKLGIIADEIYDIMSIPEEKLATKNKLKSEKNSLTQSEIVINEKVISILNISKLLKDDRLYIDIN